MNYYNGSEIALVFWYTNIIKLTQVRLMTQDYKLKYYALLKEYHKLEIELNETKKILETYAGEEVETTQPAPVNSQSASDLVSLFAMLFQGRSDVYAKMYYNKNTNKNEYATQCSNEWEEGICDKKKPKEQRKYKCKTCPNRRYKQLTPTIIESHLRGQDSQFKEVVIGIYPILSDETCYFLAVDFDKENWQKDVAAFRKTCSDKGIPVYIERSRSGNGAHAWFFFTEKIPIKLARKLGNLLLTETMNVHYQLNFKSYDRLFPNQDNIPKGGLGNLIALPLQGQAVHKGNSVFIDEEFNMIQNQWNLLATVEKLSLTQIQKLMFTLRCLSGCIING